MEARSGKRESREWGKPRNHPKLKAQPLNLLRAGGTSLCDLAAQWIDVGRRGGGGNVGWLQCNLEGRCVAVRVSKSSCAQTVCLACYPSVFLAALDLKTIRALHGSTMWTMSVRHGATTIKCQTSGEALQAKGLIGAATHAFFTCIIYIYTHSRYVYTHKGERLGGFLTEAFRPWASVRG